MNSVTFSRRLDEKLKTLVVSKKETEYLELRSEKILSTE